MSYKRLFTLRCFRPCALCWVYRGQWSAPPSCWQALACSLWACCPSTPYHRSIDLLLQVPASASLSPPFSCHCLSLCSPCLFSSICSSVRPSVSLSALPFVFLLLSSAVFSCLLVSLYQSICLSVILLFPRICRPSSWSISLFVSLFLCQIFILKWIN